MKLVVSQADLVIGISQSAIGPVVTLGFGAAGAPANLADAPTASSIDTGDTVLIQRAGQLQQIGANVFTAGVGGVTQAQVVFAVGVETSRAMLAEAADLAAANAAQATANGAAASTAGETERALTAESGLAASIAGETAARQAADTSLTGSLSAETVARAAADAALSGSVSGETAARQTADTALSGSLSAETVARVAFDAGLQADIVAVQAAPALQPTIEVALTAFENSTGTANLYLDAASCPVGGTINPAAILNAALAYSYANGVPVRAPNKLYDGMTEAVVIPPGPVSLYGGPNTKFQFTASVGAMVVDQNNNGPYGPADFRDVQFGFRCTVINGKTGAVVPPGTPPGIWHFNAGDLTGNPILFSVATDPLNPPAKGAVAIPLPVGAFNNVYGLGPSPTLAAINAVVVNTYLVQPHFMPYAYALYASSVTQPGGPGTGYILNLASNVTNPPNNSGAPSLNHGMGGYTLGIGQDVVASTALVIDTEDLKYIEVGDTVLVPGTGTLIGPVTGITDNVVSVTTPVTLTAGTMVTFGSGTMVNFVAKPPVFYSGNGVATNGQGKFQRVYISGISHGNAWAVGGGAASSKPGVIMDCGSCYSVVTAGAGGIHPHSGTWYIDGGLYVSGDQCAAFVENGGGLRVRARGMTCVSAGGQALSISSSDPNRKQMSSWPCSTSLSTGIGSVLEMDLGSFPLDNSSWSTQNTLTAAQAFAAQVTASGTDATQQITGYLRIGGENPAIGTIIGAVPDSTSGTFNTTLSRAGAPIIGVSISGTTSVAVTFGDIAGQANPISQTLAAGSGETLTLSYGFLPWSSGDDVRVTDCDFISFHNGPLNSFNKDNSQPMAVYIANNRFDMSYCTDDTTQQGFAIGGPAAAGGYSLALLYNKFRGLYGLPNHISGGVSYLDMRGNEIAASSLPGITTLVVSGVAAGIIEANRIHANVSQPILCGAADSIDAIDEIIRGNNGMTAPLQIRDNIFYVPDGFFGHNTQYGRYEIRRNKVVPVNPSPTGNTAGGFFTGTAAINQQGIVIDSEDYSSIGTSGVGINSLALNTGYGCTGCTVGRNNIPPAGQNIIPLEAPSSVGTLSMAALGPYALTAPIVEITAASAISTAQIWAQNAAQTVSNFTTFTVPILPPTGGQIGTLAVNATYPLAPGATVQFNPVGAVTKWAPIGTNVSNVAAASILSVGTWTPTITFDVQGDLSVVYSAQSGVWKQVGSLLYVSFTATFTATYTTASGNLRIALPFTSANNGDNSPLAIINPITSDLSWPNNGTMLVVEVQPNKSYGYLLGLKSANGGGTAGTGQIVSGSAYSISAAGWYPLS